MATFDQRLQAVMEAEEHGRRELESEKAELDAMRADRARELEAAEQRLAEARSLLAEAHEQEHAHRAALR